MYKILIIILYKNKIGVENTGLLQQIAQNNGVCWKYQYNAIR